MRVRHNGESRELGLAERTRRMVDTCAIVGLSPGRFGYDPNLVPNCHRLSDLSDPALIGARNT